MRLEHQIAARARRLDRLGTGLESHLLAFGHLLERAPHPAQALEADIVGCIRREVEDVTALARVPWHLDVYRPAATTQMPLDVEPVRVRISAGPGRDGRVPDDRQSSDREKESSAHDDLLGYA